MSGCTNWINYVSLLLMIMWSWFEKIMSPMVVILVPSRPLIIFSVTSIFLPFPTKSSNSSSLFLYALIWILPIISMVLIIPYQFQTVDEKSISMDVLNGLPMTFWKHDVICVIIFYLFKMTLFVPGTKTTTVAMTVDLFFTHVDSLWPPFQHHLKLRCTFS